MMRHDKELGDRSFSATIMIGFLAIFVAIAVGISICIVKSNTDIDRKYEDVMETRELIVCKVGNFWESTTFNMEKINNTSDSDYYRFENDKGEFYEYNKEDYNMECYPIEVDVNDERLD